MTVTGGTKIIRTKEGIASLIRRVRLVPVVRVSSREHAICAAEGIVGAGCPLIEITLTVPGAIGIIEELAARFEGSLAVGAGTALDADMCQAAVSAGAAFIVSPAFDLTVIESAQQLDVVCIPGAMTPTEVITAWKAGAAFVKVFPCGLIGGSRYIRVLKGPFPQVELIPSSGVNIDNAAEFLAAGCSAVAVGEPIFAPAALGEGNASLISSNAQRFMQVCASE